MSETVISEPQVDADGYRLVKGYRVRTIASDGPQKTEIIVSPEKRIVIQDLKMSEQFDLYEFLSGSSNPSYLSMASLAAGVRALGNQPIGTPVAPVFFPKNAAQLRERLDAIGDDGIVAIIAVQTPEDDDDVSNQDHAAIAKN